MRRGRWCCTVENPWTDADGVDALWGVEDRDGFHHRDLLIRPILRPIFPVSPTSVPLPSNRPNPTPPFQDPPKCQDRLTTQTPSPHYPHYSSPSTSHPPSYNTTHTISTICISAKLRSIFPCTQSLPSTHPWPIINSPLHTPKTITLPPILPLPPRRFPRLDILQDLIIIISKLLNSRFCAIRRRT